MLGDISIERDWGWAPEYVGAMWAMLQQKNPDDYIVATGKTYSLTDFISAVFEYLNMNWKDHVRVNKEFLRPTDIQSIAANPKKAETILGWKARFRTPDVAKLMVEAELQSILPPEKIKKMLNKRPDTDPSK